jgi:hypothetical protein
LEATFGFLGSLILNPRRKCDLPQDHQKRIAHLEEGEKPHYPFEIKARQLVLGVLSDRITLESELNKLSLQKGSSSLLFMSAKYLGYVLGKKLYDGLIQDVVGLSEIQRLFLQEQSLQNQSFKKRFERLQSLVSPIPTRSSKTDLL